jgi:transposase
VTRWCRAIRVKPSDVEPSPERLLAVLHGWRDEAVRAGRTITRIALAFEAGRDGFWLARWLEARAVEAHVIHASGVAVSREHRRAKTDRLDTELLKRGFLGWLRGDAPATPEPARAPRRSLDCLDRRSGKIYWYSEFGESDGECAAAGRPYRHRGARRLSDRVVR